MPAISEVNSVSRIMATLISGDAVERPRQDIDNLALTFVAPLGADHCEILFH